jgi:hypothetical protein
MPPLHPTASCTTQVSASILPPQSTSHPPEAMDPNTQSPTSSPRNSLFAAGPTPSQFPRRSLMPHPSSLKGTSTRLVWCQINRIRYRPDCLPAQPWVLEWIRRTKMLVLSMLLPNRLLCVVAGEYHHRHPILYGPLWSRPVLLPPRRSPLHPPKKLRSSPHHHHHNARLQGSPSSHHHLASPHR